MEEARVHVEVADLAVRGEVSIRVQPGTKAAAQNRMLDRALGTALAEAAYALGVVLAASPSKYAFQQPGKDEEGRTRFVVSGVIEGERLVPKRP